MKCLECGRELVRITTTHLRVCCGLSVAEYRSKHPDAPTIDIAFEHNVSPEERKRRRAEYKLRWQRKHPDNYRKSMRKWELANPDKVNARNKEWYAKHPDKARLKAKRIRLRLSFDMTIEQYETILAAQEGVCAICGKPETARGWHYLSVDHCHRTGHIRGLLCNRCNLALGLLQDSPELLRAAALYLERFAAIEVEPPTPSADQSE